MPPSSGHVAQFDRLDFKLGSVWGKKSPQRGGQCTVNAAGNEARPSFSSFVFLHKNLFVMFFPPFQLPVAAARTQEKLNSQSSHRGCLTAV